MRVGACALMEFIWKGTILAIISFIPTVISNGKGMEWNTAYRNPIYSYRNPLIFRVFVMVDAAFFEGFYYRHPSSRDHDEEETQWKGDSRHGVVPVVTVDCVSE